MRVFAHPVAYIPQSSLALMTLLVQLLERDVVFALRRMVSRTVLPALGTFTSLRRFVEALSVTDLMVETMCGVAVVSVRYFPAVVLEGWRPKDLVVDAAQLQFPRFQVFAIRLGLWEIELAFAVLYEQRLSCDEVWAIFILKSFLAVSSESRCGLPIVDIATCTMRDRSLKYEVEDRPLGVRVIPRYGNSLKNSSSCPLSSSLLATIPPFRNSIAKSRGETGCLLGPVRWSV